ncbi:MAG: hypothetical protein RSE94_08675 [Pseudomonas sp.]
MEVFLLIAKYVGLLITGGMAVFSLFFEFTTTAPGSTRKTLTTPGRIALAVTASSIVIGIGAAIVGDIRDARTQQTLAAEQRRLIKELNLSNETLSKLELHLEFDTAIDWRDKNFLSTALAEALYGSWTGKTSVFLADWVLSKQPEKQRALREAMIVETRPDVIKKFVEQNQPDLLSDLPDELLLVTNGDRVKPYTPPSALYLDYPENQQSTIRFNVDYSPLDHYRYPSTDTRKGLLFTISFTKSYSEILNSTVGIAYRFTSPGFTQTGPSPFDRKPVSEPFVLSHLKSINLYLDGQLLAEIWHRPASGKIAVRPNSVLDLKENSYYVRLVDYRITRDVLLDRFDPARQQTPR